MKFSTAAARMSKNCVIAKLGDCVKLGPRTCLMYSLNGHLGYKVPNKDKFQWREVNMYKCIASCMAPLKIRTVT